MFQATAPVGGVVGADDSRPAKRLRKGEVEEDVFVVNKIVKHWVSAEGIKVLIRWVKYGPDEDTIQPVADVGHNSAAMRAYNAQVFRQRKVELYDSGEHVSPAACLSVFLTRLCCLVLERRGTTIANASGCVPVFQPSNP